MQDEEITLEEFEKLNKNNATKNNFQVKQGRFEGPYTKILELIESRKLSISEISLSAIADDYINYVKSLEIINALELSQFIQTASTLMLIKAKSLLPQLEYTTEEKEEVSTLEKKLELYKELKEGEENIKNIWIKNIMYNKKRSQIKIEIYSWPISATAQNIFSVALATLAKMPNFERLKNVAVRQAIKLEDVIEKMISRIGESMTSLKTFAKNISGVNNNDNQKEIKKNIIVSFLALLELLKHGNIIATENNGDIEIQKIKK